ncbi:MAG: membrane protein insertion efficiency factor YidD [Dehalococcoidia bacterium]
MKRLLLAAIRMYQGAISPALGARCRFQPSCSQYTYEAIERHGSARGTWLGVKRLCRCRPGQAGGYDPVPEPASGLGPQTRIVKN